MDIELRKQVERLVDREGKTLRNYYDQENFRDWHLSTLSDINSKIGYLEYFFTHDPEAFKHRMSNVGIIDIYLATNFTKSHSRFLDFDISRCLTPVLSDNEILISQYADLRYSKGEGEESMDERVLKGDSSIWCSTIQFLMGNQGDLVERNLNIIETITLKRLPKNQAELKLDYNFLRLLTEKNVSKCEEILSELLAPKIHNKRNEHPLLSKYVSQPAFGYAKLAWRKGVQVNISHPLIPVDLLRNEPNHSYNAPYEFLK